ncbi:MAG: heavy metal-associated domain-containing protein [Myxococcota bacterium]
MLGGMVGGWLAGLLDEHRGAPEHDNPVMVASMALMAGMMGGMPSGMIGGMMAVMGAPAIALTVGAGLALIVAAWAIAVRGRYSLVRDPAPAPSAATIRGPNVDGLAPGATPSPAGGATLRLSGLTCGACVGRVERGLGAVPGVVRVEVDLPTGTVVVAWGDGFAGIDAVHAAIDALGYARLAG